MERKIVCVVTATRAEYGLLKPVINQLHKKSMLEVRLVVTGLHFSNKHGETWKEIEQDGIEFEKIIVNILDEGSSQSVSACMAETIIKFSNYFTDRKPDLLLVLGDRFEMVAICIAAINEGIPIGHIHGGETTEGAVDECFRHSMTKMSYLHFVAAEEYKKRVIQLGEQPERVFLTGALGVENILCLKKMSRKELELCLGISLNGEFALVTFHPVTLEKDEVETQCKALIEAMHEESSLFYIITSANVDVGGTIVNQFLKEFANTHTNSLFVPSLGTVKYLSLMEKCSMVLGNSSSGIIEAPVFHVPTVNIGNRQKGRLMAKSVLTCPPEKAEIIRAMCSVRTEKWREQCRKSESLYGNGTTSETITGIVEDYLLNNKLSLKKKFYDIGW